MLKAVEAPLMGHPDKVCDLLIESVVDVYLEKDPLARFDIQALGSNSMVMIGGVAESRADFDVAEVARAAYRSVGYDDGVEVFVNVEAPVKQQEGNVRRGGAQGTAIVYGYATRETREFLPPVLVYAQALAKQIDRLRFTDSRFSWMKPDGKVQVVMDGRRVAHITIIAAHDGLIDAAQVQSVLLEHAVVPVFGDIADARVLINPAPFTAGGFALNAGVSGRKILSDTYGGLLPHGGMGLVGKDPLKPARAGTLMARFAAKTLVQEGIAGNVLITAAYSVGLQDPVIITARTGEGQDVTDEVLRRFDFRPEAIVERFNLRRPLYAGCVNYGLFGRADLPWEEVY